MRLTAEVTEEFDNSRLDHFLSLALGDDFSRSQIQKWIKAGHVSLDNNSSLKANFLVTSGEKYTIEVPVKPRQAIVPIPMNLLVVADFQDFMIIDKPVGVPTHPGPGDNATSLVNGLLYQFQELSPGNDDNRPGIVHRLDKPTSGLLIIAKNDKAHLHLSRLFQDRKVYKRYYAWVLNAPKESSGTINSPIKRHPVERMKMCINEHGRPSVTHYKVLKTMVGKSGQKYSLVEVEIETGRTHQIRVHMQSIGCSVVGDVLYSRSFQKYEKFGLLLFSQKLEFTDPFTGQTVSAELPFPDRFTEFENKIRDL